MPIDITDLRKRISEANAQKNKVQDTSASGVSFDELRERQRALAKERHATEEQKMFEDAEERLKVQQGFAALDKQLASMGGTGVTDYYNTPQGQQNVYDALTSAFDKSRAIYDKRAEEEAAKDPYQRLRDNGLTYLDATSTLGPSTEVAQAEARGWIDDAALKMNTDIRKSIEDIKPEDIMQSINLTEGFGELSNVVPAAKPLELLMEGVEGAVKDIARDEAAADVKRKAIEDPEKYEYHNTFRTDADAFVKKVVEDISANLDNGDGYVTIGEERYPTDAVKAILPAVVYQQYHPELMEKNAAYRDKVFMENTGKTYKEYMKSHVDELKEEIKTLRDKAGDVAYWDKKREVNNYLANAEGGTETIPRSARTEALEAEGIAEEPYNDVLEKIEAWEDNDFASGFSESFDIFDFATLGLGPILQGYSEKQIYDKVNNGEALSKEEASLLRLRQIEAEIEGLRDVVFETPSIWSKIGSGLGSTVAAAPEFALAMPLTGGIGAAAKYGTKGALKSFIANKTLKNAAKLAGTATLDLAKYSGINYARGMAAAPIMPSFYNGVLTEYNSQYSFDEDGNLKYSPKSDASMWLAGYVDAVNEVTSEHFGVGFGKVIGLGAKAFGKGLGIDKFFNKSVTGATIRRAAQAPLTQTAKKTLKNVGFSGAGDPVGEVFGDLMSQWQRRMVGADYSFEHFHDFDYWLTTLGVSALYGGALTLTVGAVNIEREAKMVKDIAGERKRILDTKIQNPELRDKLRVLADADNTVVAAAELSKFFRENPKLEDTDKGYALDFMKLNSTLKVVMGDVEEQERMQKFEAHRKEIEGRAYIGADGQPTNTIMQATDKNGNTYFVHRGDVSNKDAMIEVIDANTGAKNAIIASELTVDASTTVDSVLLDSYDQLFSVEDEVQRIKTAQETLASLENITIDDIETAAQNLDIALPKKGDVVTMVDGREVEVIEDMGDGTYIGQRKGIFGEAEVISFPFDGIRSNDSVTAEAQKVILEESLAAATIAEAATPTTAATPASQPTGINVGAVALMPNNEQVRIVEINNDGTAVVDHNVDGSGRAEDMELEVVKLAELHTPEAAPVTPMAEETPQADIPAAPQVEATTATMPQTSAEAAQEVQGASQAVDAAESVEQVPTMKDGTIDYDAIEDPRKCAQLMAKNFGGPENALAMVEESIEAVEAEMEKVAKTKAPTINDSVAKQTKIAELKARLIRYEAIAFELEQMMKPEEVETDDKAEEVKHEAGLVENEHTAGLPEAMRKSIDEMAKRAKVRIEFVNERIKGDAEQKGNLIRVSTRNRTKAVEVLVGHEMLHYMKSKMPEAYKAFKEAVIAFMGEKKFGKAVAARKAMYAAQNVTLDDEAAAEEIVADYAGFLVQGRDVFEKFIEPKKSDNVFLRGLKKGLEYIRNIFGTNGMTKQVKAVDNMVDALNTLINATVEGKDIENREEASAETTKNEEAKGEDGNTNYSLKGDVKYALSEETTKIFDAAKAKFGTTYDMREAGYILPDGSMLDFSGRHQVEGDASFLNGDRTVDHREISDIAYDNDDNETGVNTDLGDFLDRGAIRIDSNAGAINLNVAPTKVQKDRLKRLIERNDGYVYIDFGKGWDTEHYAEYEAARASRVLGDIDRYFDEGIKPAGNVKFSLREANDRFNEELDAFKAGQNVSELHLGTPSPLLRACGVSAAEIFITAKTLRDHLKKHNLTEDEIKNLPIAINDPIMVYEWGEKAKSKIIITQIPRGEQRITVAIKMERGGRRLSVNELASVHGKDVERLMNEMLTTKSDFGKDNLKYVNKEIAMQWLGIAPPEGAASLTDAQQSIAKIIQDFENPKIEAKYSLSTAPTFYSNAEFAVRGIKQEKATPEQWLKMVEKAGGLKAGEDKWLGLSDWLKASDKKTLTKDEVLQYIAENDIQIEEVSYGDVADISREEIYESAEFAELREGLTEYDEDDNPYINRERYDELRSESYDFVDGFSLDYWGEELEVDSPAAAATYLGLTKADKEINETRLNYTTQGLSNKREIALTVPTIEPWNTNDDIHFGDAGEGRAVAWARFGETTDADGKRVLVIDEIQSKRHQEGREKGYNNPRVIEIFTRLAEIESNLYSQGISMEMQTEREALKAELESIFEEENPVMKSLAEQIDEKKSKRTELIKEKMNEDEERAEIYRLREKQNQVRNNRDYDYYEAEISEIEDRIEQRHEDIDLLNSNIVDLQLEYSRLYNKEVSNARVGVSPAPFEKNWAELAFKRMLRYAAENGYDYVAWTTGDQQADRYDIGSVVKDIVAYDTKDADGNPIKKMKFRMNNMGTYNIATNMEGVIVKGDGEMKEGMLLSDITGKALAEKIMSGEGEDAMVFENGKDIEAKSLEGEELHIGNEGMKAFYDQMLPSFVKKYTKKWGAEVGEVTMPDLEENNTMHAVNVTDSMRESVMQGQPKFSLQTINALSDALSEYNTNGDIASFVDVVSAENARFGGHPYLTNLIMDYEEDGNAEWFAEKIKGVIGEDNEDYAPYTAGGVKYSLSSSNKSAIRYDKENGTNVKEFFDFLRNGKVFEDGKPDLFYIANAGELLQRYGIKGKFMVGRFTYSNKHTKDEAHKLDVKEWVDVINTINTPLAIASYKGRPNEYRIYTYAMLNGENICVGVNVSLKNNEIELSNIISAYGRNINKLFGPELVYLLHPKSVKELKRKISQVSTEPNSPLNATSAASANKDTTSNAEIQTNEQKFSLITPEMDASYLDAVERGDMATAQRMVMEVAEKAGYIADTSYQGSLAFNGAAPMANDYFETKDQRKEAWDNGNYEGTMSLGDYADSNIDTNDLEWQLTDRGNYRRAEDYAKESIDNINNTLKGDSHKITIYRAVPNNVEEGTVRNGDWVTPSRKYAEFHIGLQDWEGGRIIEQEVDIDNLWWNGDDINEWGYDDGSNYGYRNTANSRKLLDPVTYDDAGNIIPLSERFNPEKEDIRYSLRSMDEGIAILRNKATEYNIDIPLMLIENADEYVKLMREENVKNPEKKANAFATYLSDRKMICFNGSHFLDADDELVADVIMHEYAHHATHQIWADVVKAVTDTNRDSILWVRDNLLDTHYNNITPAGTINEIISTFVEGMGEEVRHKVFSGEYEIAKFLSLYEKEINDTEGLPDGARAVMKLIYPLIAKNLEIIKKQYNGKRENNIILRRDASNGERSKRSGEESNRQLEASEMDLRNSRYNGWRETNERGGGAESRRLHQEVRTKVNYSLPSIPFYDEQGNAIDLSTLSEAKALEMMDSRVRTMLEDDYNKRVIAIAKEAKEARKATRAYYAEERRKRRGANAVPRTNYAKLQELFADTDISSLPLEVQALIRIASGDAKIYWADRDGKKGLASELGLKDSATDKKAMQSIWSGATQSFDEVVHNWWESINGNERGIDTQDLRNALIDALLSFPNSRDAMRELQSRYDAIANAEREALEEIDRREGAELDAAKTEYMERQARFELSEGEEREALRAMAVEHYSSQPMSAAEEALEAITAELNRVERRLEVTRKNSQNQYAAFAEALGKGKEVILRTLEGLRMFSGMDSITLEEVAKLIAMVRTARSKAQLGAVATKAKNLVQRIAIKKARENMRRLLELKLSNVDVIQQILKESNTLPREERDALLKSLWKVSRNGWRATKAVHPDTKDVFKMLNNLVQKYKKKVKVTKGYYSIDAALAEVEKKLHPGVVIDKQTGKVVDNSALPTDYDNSIQQTALFLFKTYLEVKAKNDAYRAAAKKLRETAKDSEKFGAALAEMYDARDAYLAALKDYNATLEGVIVNGKDDVHDFNIRKEKHATEIRQMGIEAIGGAPASSQGKAAKGLMKIRAGLNTTVNAPFWTFEMVIERIDHLTPYKQGRFYEYFMRKFSDANNALFINYSAHMSSIGEAMAKCFPSFAKSFGIIGRNPFEMYKAVMRKAQATAIGTLEYVEKGRRRTMILNVANAMYIIAMWRQPRYRAAMEANAISQEKIDAMMAKIKEANEGYIPFMNWVNDTFLPGTRLEYDVVHRNINGGSMAKEENYFPAKVAAHQEVKLDDQGKGKLPTSPSAIKERVSHGLMPQMGMDYFRVLEAHIQDMDKWSAFAELTEDLNILLSSDEFRRRLNEYMPGLAGDGSGAGSLYKMLYDTALIATGNYRSSSEQIIGGVQKAWATSNIAFRLWTAVKQISSVSVGITEHYYFGKHLLKAATMVGIHHEWKRAMEISPSLRNRWQSKAAGMEALMRETSQRGGYTTHRGIYEKVHDVLADLGKKAVEVGMTPNAAVDAVACAILINSVYDKAIYDITKGKREATEEEKKIAVRKAEIAFNSTQQSSEGAYLSAAQANPLYAPLTTYMNASFALHRKRMSGIRELWRIYTSKEYRAFLKEEFGVDAYNISRNDAIKDIIRGIVGDLAFSAMGWGLMNLASWITELFGGDADDDDDIAAERRSFFNTFWMPALNGYLGGGIVASALQGYDTSITPAYDELIKDIQGVFDDKGTWWYEAVEVCAKYGVGIDLKSIKNVAAGIENMWEDDGEKIPAVLKLINAPERYVKAFAGDRRAGETIEEYMTRILQLQSLFVSIKYEDFVDENGKYIGDDTPLMLMSKTEANKFLKEYDEKRIENILREYGDSSVFHRWENIDSDYREILKDMHWGYGTKPSGYPAHSKQGVILVDLDKWKSTIYAQASAANVISQRQKFLGEEETIFELLIKEMELKEQVINSYYGPANK